MSKTIIIALAVMAAGVVVIPVASSEEKGAPSTVSELVAQCGEEARRGHIRQLHASQIKAHRKRMAGLCSAWQQVSADDRAPLLQRCKTEAMVAGAVRPRGIGDRGHAVRLRTLCERLYEATT